MLYASNFVFSLPAIDSIKKCNYTKADLADKWNKLLHDPTTYYTISAWDSEAHKLITVPKNTILPNIEYEGNMPFIDRSRYHNIGRDITVSPEVKQWLAAMRMSGIECEYSDKSSSGPSLVIKSKVPLHYIEVPAGISSIQAVEADIQTLVFNAPRITVRAFAFVGSKVHNLVFKGLVCPGDNAFSNLESERITFQKGVTCISANMFSEAKIYYPIDLSHMPYLRRYTPMIKDINISMIYPKCINLLEGVPNTGTLVSDLRYHQKSGLDTYIAFGYTNKANNGIHITNTTAKKVD